MFGHDEHHEQATGTNDNPAAGPTEPTPDGSLTHVAPPSGAPTTSDSPAPATVSLPSQDTDAGDFLTDDTPPVSSTDNDQPVAPDPAITPAAVSPKAGDDADLLDIKQQALQQLTPLVDHLKQTPEEEFRTTMMMIQASDNQALIKKAYAAAGRIADDKTRAQALLDIVNEINYFTQAPATPDT